MLWVVSLLDIFQNIKVSRLMEDVSLFLVYLKLPVKSWSGSRRLAAIYNPSPYLYDIHKVTFSKITTLTHKSIIKVYESLK